MKNTLTKTDFGLTFDSAPARAGLSKTFQLLAKFLPPGYGCELRLPEGDSFSLGARPPAFCVHAVTQRGLKALESLDELRIAESYFDGDLEIEGDLLAAFSLRSALRDRHPFLRFWSARLQSLFRGQANCDRNWIQDHYDEDPEFYQLFLDRKFRCYSHGQFARPDETLESAMGRKLEATMEACRMQPGFRVLDIGAGWGSFVEYAGSRGVQVTSLTISRISERFVSELIARRNLPCRVLFEHFLEHRTPEPYDAIVNLGVTEHLPDYPATIRQYERLLKPGGRVYLDASASRTPPSTTTAQYIYPGNGKFLRLGEYLQALEQSVFNILQLGNDSDDYRRTMELWAANLDNARATIIERFGARQYRRFRLYFWSAVHAFRTRGLEAYHMVLEKPEEAQA